MTGKTANPLSVRIEGRIATITIDHPPINLLDTPLIRALGEAGRDLGSDENVSVVVLQSADPDFFVAHGDVNSILGSAGTGKRSDSSPFQALLDMFRQMPKATIGKLDGIARGGGLEILAALDMRFCSLENARVSQPEVALGIIPGAGGTSRWPRHIGCGRALELLLGGMDIDGATAEKYGMVNRAMPAAQLDDFVATLAARIAEYPPHAVAAIKRVVWQEGSLEQVLAEEAREYGDSAMHADALAAMRAFMAAGGQTREAELGDPFAGLSGPAD